MSTIVRKYRMLLVGISLLIVGAALMNIQGVSWSAETTPETGELKVVDLPIKYEIIREDNDYMVFASYDQASVEDVQKAIRAMRQTGDEWASQGRTFRASIVFARPLAIDELRAFVKENGLLVYGNVGRAWRQDGLATELLLPPEWEKDANGNFRLFKPLVGGDPIDPTSLAMGTDDKQMVGIISTEVELNADNYAGVVNDQRVAAIDVLKQVFIDLVKQKHSTAVVEHIWVPQSMVYGAMEQTGMVSRQSDK